MGMQPDAKSSAKLLQNPIVATVVAAGITAVTGVPVQPEQVIQGAKIAETGMNMQESMQKEKKGDEKGKEQEQSGNQMGM